MTKKIIAGGAVVLAALAYIVFSERPGSGAAQAMAPAGATVPSDVVQPAASSAGGSNPPVAVSDASAGTLKDGTYTGPVTNAVYGSLQVAAVISMGKLTNVTILQEPDAPGHTTDVSAMSMPLLIKEAISAQSASVDIVSGATQTSEAFQQSLGGALTFAQS